jgi:hypothetical protein
MGKPLRYHVVAPRIAITVALTWPLGALAVDPAIGSETDTGKTAGVAGWMERQEHPAATSHGAPASEPRGVARSAASTGASSQFYRYGQREPVLEDLLLAGRSPDTGNTGARDR